jgi:hypothetical protein
VDFCRADGGAMTLKVRSCVRVADGSGFHLEGRWVSLSKADREKLLRALAGAGKSL